MAAPHATFHLSTKETNILLCIAYADQKTVGNDTSSIGYDINV